MRNAAYDYLEFYGGSEEVEETEEGEVEQEIRSKGNGDWNVYFIF